MLNKMQPAMYSIYLYHHHRYHILKFPFKLGNSHPLTCLTYKHNNQQLANCNTLFQVTQYYPFSILLGLCSNPVKVSLSNLDQYCCFPISIHNRRLYLQIQKLQLALKYQVIVNTPVYLSFKAEIDLYQASLFYLKLSVLLP